MTNCSAIGAFRPLYFLFVMLVTLIATNSKAETSFKDLDDATVNIMLSYKIKFCDRNRKNHCVVDYLSNHQKLYVLGKNAYFVLNPFLHGSGEGVVVPLSGGSGEFRSRDDWLYRVSLSYDKDDAVLEAASSGLREGISLSAVYSINFEGGACKVKVRKLEHKLNLKLRYSTVTSEASCTLTKGR